MAHLCKTLGLVIILIITVLAILVSPFQADDSRSSPPTYLESLAPGMFEEDYPFLPPSPAPYSDDLSLDAQDDYGFYSPSEAPNTAESPAETIGPGVEDDYELYSPSEAPNTAESPLETPDTGVEDDYGVYSPLRDPNTVESPAETMGTDTGIAPENGGAHSPVMPSDYRAEDFVELDDGDYVEDGGESGGRNVIGFVMGAVCLVGLGGFVYKKKKKMKNQIKRAEYELAKREEI